MLLNDMIVIQANGLYYIYSQQQELKAMVYLPPDGQELFSFKCLDYMTKALAMKNKENLQTGNKDIFSAPTLRVRNNWKDLQKTKTRNTLKCYVLSAKDLLN